MAAPASGIRIAVAATGALLLLMGVAAWVAPLALASKLGVGPLNLLGQATLRADLGAFFGTAGGFAIFAAARRQGSVLAAPCCMMLLALAGRFLALALVPFDATMVPPMVAEAVMAVILGAGVRTIR